MRAEVIIAAFFGTIAFSILYSVPSRYLLSCGFIGAMGWIVYSLLMPLLGTTASIFFATVAISLISRKMAVIRKAPEIIFLISGIFPLVPGAGIYWTAYYLVSDQMSLALASGSGAFKTCLAMVLGIAVIHELPQWIFSGRRIGGKAK